MKTFLITYFGAILVNAIIYWWIDLKDVSIKEKMPYLIGSVVPGYNVLLASFTLIPLLYYSATCFFQKRIVDYKCWIIREKAKVDADTIKKYGVKSYLINAQKELDLLKEQYFLQQRSSQKSEQ